jgi:hypothetical protein
LEKEKKEVKEAQINKTKQHTLTFRQKRNSKEENTSKHCWKVNVFPVRLYLEKMCIKGTLTFLVIDFVVNQIERKTIYAPFKKIHSVKSKILNLFIITSFLGFLILKLQSNIFHYLIDHCIFAKIGLASQSNS